MKRKPYTITIEIPGLPQTINALGRRHWSAKAKEARTWRSAVALMIGSKKPPAPLKKATLICTRISSSPIDADNMAGTFKHPVDGLIDAGVLENDRLVNIGFPEYRWEKGPPKQGKIRITVTEVIETSQIQAPASNLDQGEQLGLFEPKKSHAPKARKAPKGEAATESRHRKAKR